MPLHTGEVEVTQDDEFNTVLETARTSTGFGLFRMGDPNEYLRLMTERNIASLQKHDPSISRDEVIIEIRVRAYR